MAAFATLPNELLEEILNGLDIEDISVLTRTSRSIRGALLPFLYRNVPVTWKIVEGRYTVAGTALPTLLENDHLASFVQGIHLRDPGITIERSRPQIEELTTTEITRDVERDETMIPRELGIITALVIRKCTNLKWLVVDAACLVTTDLSMALDVLFRENYVYGSDYTGKKFNYPRKHRTKTELGHLAGIRSATPEALNGVAKYRGDAQQSRLSQSLPAFLPSHSTLYPIEPKDEVPGHGTPLFQTNAHTFLKRVHISANDEARGMWDMPDWYVNPRDVLALLRFPLLEELRIHYLCPDFVHDANGRRVIDEGWDRFPITNPGTLPRLYPVTSLSLIATGINPEGLAKLLSFMPNITHLEYDYHAIGYEIADWDDEWRKYGTFNGFKFQQALQCIRSTLISLAVSFTPINTSGEDLLTFAYWYISKSVCCLKDLPSLRKLRIPPEILCGRGDIRRMPLLEKLLPESLELLHLTYSKDLEDNTWEYGYKRQALLAGLEKFVAACGESMSHLKELKVEIEYSDHPQFHWDDTSSQKVRDWCKEKGLRCEIISV